MIATGQLDRPPFLADRPIAWSPDGQWIAYLSVGEGQFQNPHIVASVNGGGGKPDQRSSRTPSATRSRGARTARICCSTRRSARSRRQVARVDLVPRTPRFREDQFRDLFQQPSRPGTPTEPAPRPAAPQRDSATAARRFGPRRGAQSRREIVFDDIRRRDQHSCRSASTRAASSSAPTARRRCSTPPPPARRICTPSRSTSWRAVPRSRDSSLRRPASSRTRSSVADGREVYYLENGRISAINVDSRRACDQSPYRRARRRLRAREARRVSRRRGAFSPTTSSTPNMNGVDWTASSGAVRAVRRRRAEHRRSPPHHAPHGRRAECVALRRERSELLAAAERRPARRALRSQRVRARRKAACHRSADR